MIIISEWIGRTGNNVLQLIRAIYYAIKTGNSLVEFPHDQIFTSSRIIICDKPHNTQHTIRDTFFYLKQFEMNDPEPYEMKNIFNKFIRPIFIPTCKGSLLNYNDSNKSTEIYIHIRGGDIFSSNPHSAYIQPPLFYYTNIIEKYERVYLIAEDDSNPCVNELLKLSKVKMIKDCLEKELEILSNVENLIVGFGTFGYLLYLMNPCLKELYIPKYFIEELPKGEWGKGININIIDLPNYIKVGEWTNSITQRKLMIEYTI